MSGFSFEVLDRDQVSNARAGLIKPEGVTSRLPIWFPWPPWAACALWAPNDLVSLGVSCALANTYHLT